MKTPEQGELWRHVKTGGDYLVICIATDEADGDEVVVYQSLKTGRFWTRKLSVWMTPGRFSFLSRGEKLG